MKKYDDYGEGKRRCANEVIEWVRKEKEQIKNVEFNGDTHKRAALSGQLRLLARLKVYLEVKKVKLKQKV